MPVTVAVNDRTVVHKASEGLAVGFPDACMTPPNGQVIPYLNTAHSQDAAGTAASVFCDGHAVMKLSSFFATSYGDEPGSLGGVISGTFKGKASFITASQNVFTEGEPTPRADDYVEGNHGSPANLSLVRWIQKIFSAFPWEKVVVCAAICFCHAAGQRGPCVAFALATPGFTKKGKGSAHSEGHAFIWEPRVPGIYVEVTFVPGRGRKAAKWVPVLTKTKNAAGVPIPSSEHIPGSIRPDVVVAEDASKPLTPDNIKKVYEIKFPRDEESDTQKDEYPKIAGEERYEVLRIQSCNCKNYTVPPVRLRLPKWEKLKQPEREKGWWDDIKEPPPITPPLPLPRPTPMPGPVPAPNIFPLLIPDSFWDIDPATGNPREPIA